MVTTKDDRRIEKQIANSHYSAFLDAWLTGTAMYWERRARQLEAARPRPGDWYPPGKPASEVAAAWHRLTEAAAACRARATLAEASRSELDETFGDIARAADLELLDAERALRAAIDTGDHTEIARLEQLIDDLDGSTRPRRRSTAA